MEKSKGPETLISEPAFSVEQAEQKEIRIPIIEQSIRELPEKIQKIARCYCNCVYNGGTAEDGIQAVAESFEVSKNRAELYVKCAMKSLENICKNKGIDLSAFIPLALLNRENICGSPIQKLRNKWAELSISKKALSVIIAILMTMYFGDIGTKEIRNAVGNQTDKATLPQSSQEEDKETLSEILIGMGDSLVEWAKQLLDIKSDNS